MGTTATSLHVMRPHRKTPAALATDVERAYRKLGFTAPPKRGPAPAKRVVLAGSDADQYLSIYDSDNDLIDSGDLKELGVLLSKRLAGPVIFTSVYDSRSYEFIVFYKGKQKDAALSDPDDHSGGLRMLSGKQRAKEWMAMFGRAPEASAPREEVFAEWDLARWCKTVGLSPTRATTILADLDAEPLSGRATLFFGERKASTVAVLGGAMSTQTFEVFRDPDHDFGHRLFPNAWPVAAGETSMSWYAVTTGGGFSGLRIRPNLESSAGARIVSTGAAALPFFNGQLTMGNIAAKHQWTELAGRLVTDVPATWEAPDFVVPPLDVESRRTFLIILQLGVQLPDHGFVGAAPFMETMSAPADAIQLPPVKHSALDPAWLPLGPSVFERVRDYCRNHVPGWAKRAGISEDRLWEKIVDAFVNETYVYAGPTEEQLTLAQHVALLRNGDQERAAELQRILNSTAVAFGTAILAANGERERAQARALLEAWLACLPAERGTVVTVRAEKHATPSFSVSKTNWSARLESLAADKRWAELFGTERDYRSVYVDLTLPGAAYPQAGAVCQGSDRRGPGAAAAGEVLNCSVWLIDDAAVCARLGTTASSQTTTFEEWLEQTDALQAWSSRAAWIPDLGGYRTRTAAHGTPYERAALLDGRMARETCNTRSWTERHLRFVAPRLWLGASLRARIELDAVVRCAVVHESGSLAELTLREGAALNDLERALAPILPALPE
jgi:hypothetical protein